MAIGFEFATGWKIFREDKKLFGKKRLRSLGKAAVIKDFAGYSMTVDGDEIEYVVKPVEENSAGEGILRARMRALSDFVARLDANKGLTQFKTRDLGGILADTDLVIVNDYAGTPIEAIPQVTGGFRLGRMRKLLRILADSDTTAAKQFFGENAGIYSKMYGRVTIHHANIIDSRWPGHRPSAKLRGLVTLIATYLYRGRAPTATTPMKAAKYLFVIMSRTSFATLFDQLPRDEREHYRAAPDDWVHFICSDIMSQVDGLSAGLDANGKVIEYLISDQGNLKGNDRVSIPITRKAWLQGMTAQQDLLSAKAHPIDRTHRQNIPIYKDSVAGLGHRLRGLAGLGNTTDLVTYRGRPEEMAIVEFRARQNKLPYTEWEDYALRCFRFVQDINEGDRHGVVDLQAPAVRA